MSAPLHALELTELATLIAGREVSPVEVTHAVLDRIAALEPRLHAYAFVMADASLAAAREAEARIAAGDYRGPLHGVPIAIKDLFFTEGVPTAAGTFVHKGFVPDEDATVVRRLREAGAVILGKTQMTEGAYSDHHPSVRPPINPWHADHWSGISSSGSAVAAAAGLCIAALGSDTGGSIRWPCAANGLTGLKPTWGRVSRHGMFELAASLDHVGPIARSAGDAAAIFAIIAGRDPNDPTTLHAPLPNDIAKLDRDMRGLRVGVDGAWNADGVDATTQGVIAQAVETFRGLGATVVDARMPEVPQLVADWFPACAVEAAVAHATTYPARKAEYGPALAAAIDAGRTLSGLDTQQIWMRRRTFRGRVAALFETIDVLLAPVQPIAAPTVDMMQTFVEDPDFVAALMRYTSPFDMSGHPTITLPAGFTAAGLPVGIQLIAADLDEATLLQAGAAFQRASDWHRRRPAIDGSSNNQRM